jgi:two-component system LytT family response regulator
MKPVIRTLIVDDELPARKKIRRFLESDKEVRIIGEARDGPEAIEAIQNSRPDLVFLDIQMPGADGFRVIEAVESARPQVIFVTAYHEHAVRAFEVEAVDYLLKPFDLRRLRTALDRAKERIHHEEPGVSGRALTRLLGELQSGLARLLVKGEERSFFVNVDEIDWIQAANNYVELHTSRGKHLIRGTLTALDERLDSSRFVRISRSAVVNLDRVKEIRDWSHGDRLLVLRDGTELILSRFYRNRLPELFDPEYS